MWVSGLASGVIYWLAKCGRFNYFFSPLWTLITLEAVAVTGLTRNRRPSWAILTSLGQNAGRILSALPGRHGGPPPQSCSCRALWLQAHTAYEVIKAVVRTQAVEKRLDLENQEKIVAFLIRFSEPVQGLAALA